MRKFLAVLSIVFWLAANACACSCNEKSCNVGEAKCEGDTPVNCYRYHNMEDEFEPPAWHKSDPCKKGYSCVEIQQMSNRYEALCVLGGEPYPGCISEMFNEADAGKYNDSICEGDTLVYCSEGYRTRDEVCPERCEERSDPDSGRSRAECLIYTTDGETCYEDNDCEHGICYRHVCTRTCKRPTQCPEPQHCADAGVCLSDQWLTWE